MLWELLTMRRSQHLALNASYLDKPSLILMYLYIIFHNAHKIGMSSSGTRSNETASCIDFDDDDKVYSKMSEEWTQVFFVHKKSTDSFFKCSRTLWRSRRLFRKLLPRQWCSFMIFFDHFSSRRNWIDLDTDLFWFHLNHDWFSLVDTKEPRRAHGESSEKFPIRRFPLGRRRKTAY